MAEERSKENSEFIKMKKELLSVNNLLESEKKRCKEFEELAMKKDSENKSLMSQLDILRETQNSELNRI